METLNTRQLFSFLLFLPGTDILHVSYLARGNTQEV